MGAARRLRVAAVGLVALATVGGAAVLGLRPEHVDRRGLPRALARVGRRRSPSRAPTVAGTEAARPARARRPG